jgi:hypothetical protein
VAKNEANFFQESLMKKEKICFDHIEVMDFYDGLVRGLAKSGSDLFLFVRIRWEIENRQRIFALLDLDSVSYASLQACFEQSAVKSKGEMWDDFEVAYNDIVHSYKKKLHFLFCEPEINNEYALEGGDYDTSVLKLTIYDIQNTII